MQSRSAIRAAVRELWHLALPGAPQVADDVPFRDLGGDSAAAVALGLLLEEEFGAILGHAAAYDHPTVDAQVEALAARLTPGETAAAPAAEPVRDWPEHAIAVVSAAVRVPGAGGPAEYWDLLRSGRCAIGRPPAGRRAGHREAGGYLDDVRSFDHRFFGISRADADYVDPQQRLALELAWEALESAGYASASRREASTGVYVGVTRPDFDDVVGPDARLNGSLVALVANRISYHFDLTGPSECVDTACSSSLVAVHRACAALAAGDCDLALAGGVSVILTDRRYRLMRANQMISPSGRLRPFDRAADGMVPGEGGGMVLLKRLADAVRDGDAILAALTGWACNNDGRSNGINAPNGAAQRAVVRAACARAGIEPSALTYVEAHGTGTPVGDAIELGALAECLAGAAPAHCGVGSVKGQIGHLEWAAGIAGLIKVVLSVQHGHLPASGAFEESGHEELLGRADCPLFVVDRVRPWAGRAAGVSSFGAGGTNCHVVVEAPPAADRPPPAEPAVLTLSAGSPEALRRRVAGLRDAVRRHPELAPGAIAAMSRGRGDFAYRLALPVRSAAELDGVLASGWRPVQAADAAPLALLLPASGAGAAVELWRRRGLRPDLVVAPSAAEIEALGARPAEAGHALPDGYWLWRPADGSAAEPHGPGEAVARLSEAGVRHLVSLDADPSAAWERAGIRVHRVADPARPEREAAADAVVELYLAGHPVTLDPPGGEDPRLRLGLPTYPFERAPRWPAPAAEPGARAYVREWRPLNASPAADSLEGRAVVLLGDTGGVADAAAERLRARGCRVLRRAQRLPHESTPGIDDGDLVGDGLDVVWLTGLPDGRDGSWESRVSRGPAALLRLGRALARRADPAPRRLYVVTAGGLPVDPDTPPDPAQHMIAGIVPTLGRELGGVRVRLLDLAPDAAAEARADLLLDALARDAPDLALSWRDGAWHRATWAEAAQTAPAAATPGGTYLVTGGLGGLGVATCEWLAASGPVHLHLVGRSAWAGDPRLARLRALEEKGSTLTCHRADAGDPYAMADVVEQIRRAGRIDGVVHAAGVLDDRAVAAFDTAGFGRRLHAKVAGARVLDDLFRDDDLAFFVLYGSAIAHVGNIGQAEYAAANRFLEALAAARRARGRHALCVAWSTWAGTGMAEGFARSAEIGLSPIRPDDALAALARALPVGAPALCVARGAPPEPDASAPARHERPPGDPTVLEVVAAALCERLGETEVDLDANLFELGADSLDLTAVMGRINEALGTSAPDALVFEAPTGRRLAAVLAELPRPPAVDDAAVAGPRPPAVEDPALASPRPPWGGDPTSIVKHGGGGKTGERDSVDNFPEGSSGGRLASAEAVAVIGMSCRFADADTPERLWSLLLSGRTAIRDIEPGRLFGDGPARAAALLDRPYDFDALTFRISPAEAPWVDPQQRLALELAWEALERAGHAGGPHPRTGVFLGAEPTRYSALLPVARHSAAGGANTTSMVANRISYTLRLGGPSVVCDTACSSSAVAVHLARSALLAGECDLALAGGVKLLIDQYGFEVNAAAGLLSGTGRLNAFGDGADGYVRGEGGAILVLRRLGDALADGDQILAVLTGTRVGHDAGDKVGLTAPSAGAQRELLAATWREAGLDPERLAFVEAHGTGTELGDSVEIRALSAALRAVGVRSRPWLGTAKSVIGHTEAAAGVAGLAKAVLCLQAVTVPPHPGAGLDLEGSGLRLPAEPVPIAVPGRAQAVVSAFGYGGTNAHAVLEQPPDVPAADRTARPPFLVPLSARTPEALGALIRALADHLTRQPPPDLADVAATLSLGRFHLATRTAFVARDTADLVRLLRAADAPGGGQGPGAKTVTVAFGDLAAPAAADLAALAPARAVLDRAAPPGEDPADWLDRCPPAVAATVAKVALLAVLNVADVTLAVGPGEDDRLPDCVRDPALLSAVLREGPSTRGSAAPGEITLGGDRPPVEQVLSALATLYAGGADVDWAALWEGHAVRRTTLPTYPFERRTFRPPRRGATRFSIARRGWRPAAGPTAAGAPWRVLGGDPALRMHLTDLLGGAEPADQVLWLPPDGDTTDVRAWSDILDFCRDIGRSGARRVVALAATGDRPGLDAALPGLLRGLEDEVPGLDVAVVRCALPDAAGDAVRRVADLLARLPRHGEFRYDGGRLLERTLEPPRPVGPGEPVPGTSGVVLVTGGLGGLGGHLATAYARAGARDVVLLGRRVPAAEPPAAAAIREAGARVRVFEADVTDRERIARVVGEVRRTMGRISAVVHAAGVFDHRNRSLRGKTPEGVAAVLAPKSAGVRVLDEVLADEPAEIGVFCSSISALGGGLAGGQADYAAANAFLDAWAEEYSGRGFATAVSLGWPQWANVGMSAGRSLPAAAEALGFTELSPEDGGELFHRILASGVRGAIAVLPDGARPAPRAQPAPDVPAGRAQPDPDASAKWADAVPGVSVTQAYAAPDGSVERAAPDRSASRARPDPDRSVTQAYAVPGTAVGGAHAAPEGSVGRVRPDLDGSVTQVHAAPGVSVGRAPAEVDRVRVADVVRAELATVLSLPPGEVGEHTSFLDLGLDSLGVADLAGALEARLGAVVDPAEILLNPSVAELAGRLAALYPAGEPEPSPEAAPPTGAGLAVVGMAGRFPGAASVPELWDLLRSGRDAVTEVPADRWDWRATYDPGGAPGTTVSRWGGFLETPGGFDLEHFGMAAEHAALVDPRQRLFLEAAWSALSDAGMLASSGVAGRCGVFVGARAVGREPSAAPEGLAREAVVGHAQNFIAARVAHHLDLRGPAIVVDTACSSSLVAVHLAAQALRDGECEIAVAGGVDLLDGPEVYTSLSGAGALSPNGRCATFSRDADGYVPGEGVGAVVLRPLAAALRDGDRIYAVLRGSAVNNDGRTVGLTTPDVEAQRAVLREAYRRAGVNPATVGLIEAHGTGTPIGDPIEVRALADVLGPAAPERDRVLGTVKTNLGHLHSAAGIGGLLKAVLCLHHRTRVPSLHCADPNPRLDLQAIGLRLLDRAEEWPGEHPRRAGVSAFGFGGTNCHVVLEEAPAAEACAAEQGEGVLLLSAPGPRAMRALAGQTLAWADAAGADLVEHSGALSDGRAAFAYRAAVRGDAAALRRGLGGIADGTTEGAEGRAARPVFVFPGQGAQYPAMARELAGRSRVFAEALAECESWLAPHLEEPPRILEEGRSTDTAVVQPLLFAVEYAMARLWRSLGVSPFAVVGHSVGEFAGMVAAGVLTGPDAALLVARRAQLMASCPPGAMLGVPLPERDAAAVLGEAIAEVDVAAVNAPDGIVLAGERAPIEACAELLRRGGVRPFPLRVSHAFHSRLMEPAAAALAGAAGGVRFAPPGAAVFVSTVTGAPIEEVGAEYVGAQVRAPVRFADAVRAARDAGGTIFVEVGPGSGLGRLVRATLGDATPALGGLPPRGSEHAAVLDAVAALWTHGLDVRTRPLLHPGRRDAPLLPPYPFERTDLGLTPARPRTTISARTDPDGTIRAARRYDADRPALRDHTVRGHRVLPGVTWAALAIEALADGGAVAVGRFRDVAFVRPLALTGGDVPAGVDLSPTGGGWRFTAWSGEGSGRATHARGRFEPGEVSLGRLDVGAVRARCGRDVSRDELYARIRGQGIVHGGHYRCLRRAWAGADEVLAELELGAAAREAEPFRVHPVLLDGATTAGAALDTHAPWTGGDGYIPFHIAELSVAGEPGDEVVCHYRVRRTDDQLAVFDFDVCAPDGAVLVSARGFASKRLPAEWDVAGAAPAPVGRVRWVPAGIGA